MRMGARRSMKSRGEQKGAEGSKRDQVVEVSGDKICIFPAFQPFPLKTHIFIMEFFEGKRESEEDDHRLWDDQH